MNLRNKVQIIFPFLLLALACDDEVTTRIPVKPENIDLAEAFYCEIDLNDRTNDTFKVRMFVDNLTEANKNFQFPALFPERTTSLISEDL